LFLPTVRAFPSRSHCPTIPLTNFRVCRMVPGPGSVTPFLASAASRIVRTLIGPPASQMISRTIRGSSPRAKCGFGAWRRGGKLKSGQPPESRLRSRPATRGAVRQAARIGSVAYGCRPACGVGWRGFYCPCSAAASASLMASRAVGPVPCFARSPPVRPTCRSHSPDGIASTARRQIAVPLRSSVRA
jgi:hypothetical protein